MSPFRQRAGSTGLVALAALVALATPTSVQAQNLYKAGRDARSLIADHRARSIGDILTIAVSEASKVINRDKIDRRNQSSLAARLEDYTLSDRTFETNQLPKIDIRQSRTFKGEGKQEQNSNVQANIAVIVVDVHPNGNLVVAGSRVVTVDDVEKTLRISGIVRPFDVTKENIVSSSQVADARIALTSEGGNARVTTRGPVATVFDTLVWAAWPF